MARPKYPKDALRNGIEGKVELRAVIAPDGQLKGLVVLSGDSEFSQSATAAIQKWRFHPEVRQAQPVETTYKIHVRFNPMLQEANSDVELESPLPEPPPSLANAHRSDLGYEIHHMSEPGMIAPKATYQIEPEFSEKARIEQQQGNVSIDVVVGADGLPQDPQVTCSSAPDQNDHAVATLKQWKFSPATKNGIPVASEIVVEFSFKLH
jgi:TonB family protein